RPAGRPPSVLAPRGRPRRITRSPRAARPVLAQEESVLRGPAVPPPADPRPGVRLPGPPGTGGLRPPGVPSRANARGPGRRPLPPAVRQPPAALRGRAVCEPGKDEVAGAGGPLLPGLPFRGAGGPA